MALFPKYLQQWRTVFESEDPEKETIPLDSGEELTRMQLLCVLRCLRPDKVVAAVQDYVAGKSDSDMGDWLESLGVWFSIHICALF